MFATSPITRLCIAVAFSACLAGTFACSNADSPTSPTPTANGPVPQPPTATPPPSAVPSGAVQITINPNPVPHSGVPIADAPGCRDVRYTWYYDQVFRETGGSAVTLTNRIDLFDDRETNNIGNLNLVVAANGTNQIRSRWCSSSKGPHSAQTRWAGTDASGKAITILGPKVSLSAAP
jgi:hypothetical protein